MSERMRVMLLLLWSMSTVACGGGTKHEEAPRMGAQSEEVVSEESANFDEVEACSMSRPGDCIPRVPSMGGSKTIMVCGYDMKVPVLSYLACKGSVDLVPAGCTVGTAVTAGGACAANLALVASTCAVAIASVEQAAECCIKGGC